MLAHEEGAPWVKYIHGSYGQGSFTFLGGHDPEDPQHAIGAPPTMMRSSDGRAPPVFSICSATPSHTVGTATPIVTSAAAISRATSGASSASAPVARPLAAGGGGAAPPLHHQPVGGPFPV